MRRLIDAKTMVVKEFWNEVPVYAILSHTWGDEEVTLQEMKARETMPVVVERKKGFAKIKKTCEQALLDGFSYVWVDTCCIDKTSSSELSEAINSMYKWYQEAEVCYAYLVDVSASQNAFDADSQFRKCRWFKRGWTLQELIAPLTVVFYDKDWVEIGTKSSLRAVITQVTNISKQVLLVNHSGEISIATRMSWVSNRVTTRIEDMAYCLLGLFGINMPILYGEGEGAFTRLQREIIATSDDHTIFAWVGGQGGAGAAGLLAKSPSAFAQSSHLAHIKVDKNRSPYNITNVGLSIELPLKSVGPLTNQYKALLNCTNDSATMYGIYLNKDKEGQYVRTRTTELFTDIEQNQYKRERIYIKEPVPSRFDVNQWMRPRANYQFLVKKLPSAQIDGFAAVQFYSNSNDNKAAGWIQESNSPGVVLHRLTLPGSGSSGGFLVESQSGPYERFVVMLGVHNYNVWCDIVTNISPSDKLETVAKSYYIDDGGTMLWENRDRLCKRLTLYDKYVFVAARKGVLNNFDYQYLVDVTITASAPPNVSAGGFGGLDMVMPQAAYRFQIIYEYHDWEVVELTAFDSIAWQRQKDKSLTLALKHSGISGIMVLRDQKTNVWVAVLLGVHNYKPWSDVIPNIKNQPGEANKIRESYYSGGPGNRNHRLWDWDMDCKVSFSRNLSVRVTTTVPVENAFLTRIVRGM
ncbi:hypothetical protein CVT25_002701 [Psilocybe cyanescens]|uniref:Heterokaryon incompatibility domain-containing protein n=1 Tax=Psilocybe cyanescens TaxID=93625 RepID=A0A409WLU1_PSICY|nr:hypothetical protein CVT25_002701 [Psilocybe cyanescens]